MLFLPRIYGKDWTSILHPKAGEGEGRERWPRPNQTPRLVGSRAGTQLSSVWRLLNTHWLDSPVGHQPILSQHPRVLSGNRFQLKRPGLPQQISSLIPGAPQKGQSPLAPSTSFFPFKLSHRSLGSFSWSLSWDPSRG